MGDVFRSSSVVGGRMTIAEATARRPLFATNCKISVPSGYKKFMGEISKTLDFPVQ
jgi:hypothetical protein